ncbi:hypothetical protein ACHAPU_002795 [Fusarium lateritium]
MTTEFPFLLPAVDGGFEIAENEIFSRKAIYPNHEERLMFLRVAYDMKFIWSKERQTYDTWAVYQERQDIPKQSGQGERLGALFDFFDDGDRDCLKIVMRAGFVWITIVEAEGQNKYADKNIHKMMEAKGLLAEFVRVPDEQRAGLTPGIPVRDLL